MDPFYLECIFGRYTETICLKKVFMFKQQLQNSLSAAEFYFFPNLNYNSVVQVPLSKICLGMLFSSSACCSMEIKNLLLRSQAEANAAQQYQYLPSQVVMKSVHLTHSYCELTGTSWDISEDVSILAKITLRQGISWILLPDVPWAHCLKGSQCDQWTPSVLDTL